MDGDTKEVPKEIPIQLQRYDVELDNLDKAICALREALIPVMSQPKPSDVDLDHGENPVCPLANELFSLNNKLCSLYVGIDGIINSLEV